MEKLATRCARYRAERDCARQDAARMRAELEARRRVDAKDAEAARWVRKQGGLLSVQVELAEGEGFGNIVDAVAARLGTSTEGFDSQAARERVMDALDRRLMPEGMEWLIEAWPKFEDDAPVKLGDMALIDGDVDMVEAVQIWIHGKPVIYGDNGSQQLEKAERVKRPAPEVLDADGVEVEVGDDLYSVEGSLKFHVSHIDRVNGKIATDAMFSLDKWADPKMYTHRAPVPAADGEPLEPGQTVWFKTSGREMRVDKIEHRPEGFWALELFADGSKRNSAPASVLTHERPDSWERLEEDATKLSPYYYARDVMGLDTDKMPPKESRRIDMMRDIVRRARALAERGQ